MEKMLGRHHEVAIFQGTVPEAEESAWGWQKCEKNPGHEKFIPVPDFVDNYLPRIQDVKERENLKGLIDRTVRLRVNYTSLDRPEGDDISDLRGKPGLRVGTGFIIDVSVPVDNKPCRCFGCGGKVMRRHWEIHVYTAHHVVYNTEEAKTTKVDLFYDDTNSNKHGRMKSLWGLEVVGSNPDRDVCLMMCVTCDEGLLERIEHARLGKFKDVSSRDLKENRCDLGLLQSCHEDCVPVLIVSHPHGQPKQITVGERKYDDGSDTRQYTTPTCPGSSGAPVVLIDGRGNFYLYSATHSGSYGETSTERYDRPRLLKRLFNKLRGQETQTPTQQLNYGHLWFGRLNKKDLDLID